MDSSIYTGLCYLLLTAVGGFGFAILLSRLRRTRPDLKIGTALAVGLGLRLLAAAAVSQLSLAAFLRGGDERLFIAQAEGLAGRSLAGEQSLDALFSNLHVWVFSLQLRLLDPPIAALRVSQAVIALLGIALIAAAVHDLAGPRAASIVAWVFAVEPSGVFFSTLLHKESLLFLAEGLVVFGAARLWTTLDLRSLLPIALGCAMATATRSYAGWFLIAAAVAILLHASARGVRRALPATTIVGVVVIAVAVTAPTVWNAGSQRELSKLQSSQDANTANVGAETQGNLALESVDFSSRGAVISNLPRRIQDVLLRPYPWQLDNLSQQLGFLGTLVVLFTLFMLVRLVLRERWQALGRAGPLLYPALFLLVAYSLSAGNAGTAYRYRVHVILLALAGVVTLLATRQGAEKARASSDAEVLDSGSSPRPGVMPTRRVA